MRALAETLYECSHFDVLLERALEGAISVTGADRGNIQIASVSGGPLRIAAHSGFSSEFLEYFAVVEGTSSACGRAAVDRRQTVVVDVDRDAGFAPHRQIAAASGFRAVQSTPLIDGTGRLRGVISTHFRQPHRPAARDMQLMQWFGEHIAAAFVRQQKTPKALYEATAVLHAQSAALQDTAAALINETARELLATGNIRAAAVRQGWARLAQDRAWEERRRTAVAERRARPHPAPLDPVLHSGRRSR
jgi:GAF domain-containing protein